MGAAGQKTFKSNAADGEKPMAGENDTFEVYKDKRGEFRWRAALLGRESSLALVGRERGLRAGEVFLEVVREF